MGAEYREVKPLGAPTLQVDEALNDSDKVLTVPANRHWHILWIYVELTTSATVGNRSLRVELRDDSDDIIYRTAVRVNLAANDFVVYTFIPGVEWFGSEIQQQILTPIPPNLVLPAGFDIRIFDSAVIDVAADDMIIQMMVDELGTALGV